MNKTPGTLLKDARESKKLSLVDVANVLKIRRVYLQAIENDTYDHLPERTYILGYIRSYATYLGLDQEALLNTVREVMDKKEEEKSIIHEEVLNKRKQYNKNVSIQKKPKEKKDSTPKPKQRIVFMLILSIIVLVLTAIVLLNQSKDKDNESIQEEIITESNTIIQEDKPVQQLEQPDEVLSEEKLEIKARFVKWPPHDGAGPIALKAIGDVVITISNYTGERIYMNEILRAGEIFPVPNIPKLKLDVANISNLEIVINGTAYGNSRNIPMSGIILSEPDIKKTLKVIKAE